MPVTIKANSGGGSVTLDAGTTSTDTTLTLPSTTGTLLVASGGVLGVASGGTGAATLTANSVLIGNGTSAVTAVAPSTSGNVLTSNGTAWTSAAPVSTGITSSAAVSLSGTAVDITGIPSTAKRVTIIFNAEVSSSAAPVIRLGTSGGIVASGYTTDIAGSGSGGVGGGSDTTGHALAYFNGASYSWSGQVVFCLQPTNIWVGAGISRYAAGQLTVHQSVVSLSGTLDRIRYTTVVGTATFSAGTLNIFWE